MKKSAQNRIIIWSIVSFLLIFILIAGFVVNADGRYVPSINDRTYSQCYEVDSFYAEETSDKLRLEQYEISFINVNIINGNVIIKESDNDFIEIYSLGNSTNDEVSNLENFYYEQDYNTITIYGSEKDYDLGSQDFLLENLADLDNLITSVPSKTIVVELPIDSVMNNITVNTAKADISIKNILNTEFLSLNSYSGTISANCITPNTISINNVNGEINLSDVKAEDITAKNVLGNTNLYGDFESVTFESVSGDLNYSTKSLNTYSISGNTVSGDTNITLPQSSGFTLINSSVSGEIKSGFDGRTVDEHYIYGDGSTEIELNSVSGSVNINPLKDDKTEQEKAEQKQNEKKEASISSTSQTQPTTAKATESND